MNAPAPVTAVPAHLVKVCGMTDETAVQAALAAGADAIGFVFAPSVRRVSPAQAARLAQPARGRLLCVAVMQHPEAALVEEVLATFRPDVLQTDREDLAGIRLPPGVAAWPVLRGASAVRPDAGTHIVFEGPRSGTGKVADWNAARELAGHCRLILAGGLSPVNVAEAIAAVAPFGVDVSSGVEDAPGHKSPALVESFVSRARHAFAQAANGQME